MIKEFAKQKIKAGLLALLLLNSIGLRANVDARYFTAKHESPFSVYNVLLTAACVFFILQFAISRKFRHRQYAVMQQQAVEKERSRIAADIHDDIGAELSNIVILSQILKNTGAPQNVEALAIIHKIESSSHQVIKKMNEVIWTLDTTNNMLKNMVAYIRNYVSSFCETTQNSITIQLTDTTRFNYPLTAEYTRNIFLVIKELLNNAAKHSEAGSISISIGLIDLYTLCIDYQDDGIGFDTGQEQSGKGLANIRRRIAENGGTLTLHSRAGQGCRVTALLPIKAVKTIQAPVL